MARPLLRQIRGHDGRYPRQILGVTPDEIDLRLTDLALTSRPVVLASLKISVAVSS